MFISLGQTSLLVVLAIGIGGALLVLATIVARDAAQHDLRGGGGLYGPLVFFLAPIGLLAWVALTHRKIDHEKALIRALAVAIFNTAYSATFAAAAAAGWQ